MVYSPAGWQSELSRWMPYNSPFADGRRVHEVEQFRAAMKKKGVKEIGFATYGG